MKRVMGVLLALTILGATLAVPVAHGVEKKKVYAFDRRYIPFSFVRNQKPTGFEVEIFTAALEGTGLGIDYKPMRNWDRAQAELSSGIVQVLSGVTRTDLRNKLFVFPQTPTLTLDIRFFVNKNAGITSQQQIRGQSVAAKRDNRTQQLLANFGGVKIRFYDTDEEALQAVQTGDAQAYFGPDKTAWDVINRLDIPNMTVVGPVVHRVPIYFAVYKLEEGLRDLLDRGLRRIIASGEYDRIYRKWFVPEFKDSAIKELIAAAKEALPLAHTPRTEKATAAAVVTRSGRVYIGAGVESLGDGVSLSAMDVAVAKAVSVGDVEIHGALVISDKGVVLPPSARERELLSGFGHGILIVLEQNPGEYETWMLSRLLPYPYGTPGGPRR